MLTPEGVAKVRGLPRQSKVWAVCDWIMGVRSMSECVQITAWG